MPFDFDVAYDIAAIKDAVSAYDDIERMIDEETAKFISGTRPLNEWDDFTARREEDRHRPAVRRVHQPVPGDQGSVDGTNGTIRIDAMTCPARQPRLSSRLPPIQRPGPR